jgi:TPR repeat protein
VLPVADKDWFTSTVNDDIAFDKEIDAVCEQIDTKEVASWVTARANQGDGASLWVLSEAGLPTKDLQERLRESSAAGFALAQSWLAQLIFSSDESAAGAGANKPNPAELLNKAAIAMPSSKADLANCEYFGECEGIPVDIDAAIAHAREAAQDGYFSAILRIGPHLPAGQMDPDEVTAWSLIGASVEQQGCGGNLFTVLEMQNIMSTLNAPNITAAAHEQAENLWSEYGAQIKANLGCDP